MSKQMCGTKRKQADADEPVLLSSHEQEATLLQQPELLASTLLKWLPDDATLENQESKKLLMSFDLVRAKLQRRANVVAKKAVDAGAKENVVLSGVAVPQDIFLSVMDFLPRYEVVYTSSLVCRPWLAATRVPHFWHTLDEEHGLLVRSEHIVNAESLVKLLRRPQFKQLKSLVPPYKVQFSEGLLRKIAKACPELQELDMGYSWCSNMSADDTGLLVLPILFPKLAQIRFNQGNKITRMGFERFCKLMGKRLQSIRIRGSPFHGPIVTDETLHVLAKHCPNLERFDIETFGSPSPQHSGKGYITLLKRCQKLKILCLIRTQGKGKITVLKYLFREDCPANLDRLFLLLPRDLSRSETAKFASKLADKVGCLEICSLSDHSARVRKLRRAGKYDVYW